MTNTAMNKDFDRISEEKLPKVVTYEIKRAARKTAFSTGYPESDVESYLNSTVWKTVYENPKYQTLAGIRQVIKHRIINFLNSPTNVHKLVRLFSSMVATDEEGNEEAFENRFVTSFDPFESNSDTKIDLERFMSTLNERQRTILEMYRDNYAVNEIAKYLGVHRNTIQNTLKVIREKAYDCGLDSLLLI